jgi:hypothetical protein
MTYEEYKREIKAKGYKEAVSGRIVSKKTESTVEFLDLATETDDFVQKQEKARKNAVKATNDDELARRTSIYSPAFYHKPEAAKADPNAAFKRKKHGERGPKGGRVVSIEELDDLVDAAEERVKKDKFVVPQRHMALFRKMVGEGKGVLYAKGHIKSIMALEEAAALIRVDPPRSAPSKDVEVKRWNPENEHWEPEHEDVTITDRDAPPSFSDGNELYGLPDRSIKT